MLNHDSLSSGTSKGILTSQHVHLISSEYDLSLSALMMSKSITFRDLNWQ
jgi:hypothetical protein